MFRYRIGLALLVCLIFSVLVSACYVGYPPSSTSAASQTTIVATSHQKSSTPTLLPAEKSVTPNSTTSESSATLKVTSTPEPLSTIQPALLRGQEVQFWHAWKGAQKSTLEALVQEFNETNTWGIQVEPTSFLDLDELWKQITIASQSGHAPQIASGYLHQILSLDARQPVVDLSAYVNDPQWGLTPDEQADFFPAFWQADMIENRRVGLPAARAGQVLYYNTSWAQELGFTQAPQTPEEFKEQACAAAKSNQQDGDVQNDGTGGWIISTQPASTLGWLKAFGVPVVDEELSGYQFDTSQAEDAVSFLRELYDQGCAWLPESELAATDFADRRGLFMSGSTSDLAYQAQVMAQQKNPDQWTDLPFPSPSGDPVLPVFGPSNTLLPSTPEAQLAAWLFLKWMAEPEQSARWSAATGTLPLQASAVQKIKDGMNSATTGYPVQWSDAIELIPYAQSEPPFASWSKVRWAVLDATTQVFRDYFTIKGVPELVKLLQKTADDLHGMSKP
jgi:multiple sugar transport system substrate-binding protein